MAARQPQSQRSKRPSGKFGEKVGQMKTREIEKNNEQRAPQKREEDRTERESEGEREREREMERRPGIMVDRLIDKERKRREEIIKINLDSDRMMDKRKESKR